jgi:hypothetical protein
VGLIRGDERTRRDSQRFLRPDHRAGAFGHSRGLLHPEKAPCGGEMAGKSPVDRGKRGIKRSVAVDAQGIPLGSRLAPSPPRPTATTRRSLARYPGHREDVGVSTRTGERASGPRLRLGPHPRATGGTRPDRGDLRKGKAGAATTAPLQAPRSVGSWSEPTPGITPTRSWCGVPSGGEGSSTSGSPSRMRSSSWAGSSEKPGLGTVGRAALLADPDLLARPLSRRDFFVRTPS